VNVGQTQSITAYVRNSAKATGLVLIEVYSSQGIVHQQFWDNRTFAAGTEKAFKTSWRPTASSLKGPYRVKIGIFSPGWGTLYHWNDNAATFTVN
jgi:hypothetical protein